MAATDRLYLTTPIYYVNDKPHIGHAYCTVLADTMGRYGRLFGAETYFVTGTDEHGQKVQDAAAKRGVTPQQHTDELHHAFKDLWPLLHVENDDFICTTEPRHVEVVQRVLQRLWDQGEIYAKDYVGWYSTAAERFWTEKDLVDGRCPDTGQPVERITERNYFFRMSKYADALRAHILAHPRFIRPEHRRNEVLGFLDKGLEDLCISRPKARLSWGIELPFDADYVTYVWFDALLNYVTAIGYTRDDEMFQTWWPAARHLIGKDILTTHSVYWTTMLLAMGLPLPQEIIATGWWLSDDAAKMSKSVGNVVSPLGMRDVYGPDVLRYFLLRDMVIGLDASFSEEALVRRNNSDLANDLGNLARRVAGLVARYFEGKVPAPGEPTEVDRAMMDAVADITARVPGLVDELKLHTAIEDTLQVVRALNKYVTETEPYRVVKTDPVAAGRTLYTVLEALRHVAWLLWPVMPVKMVELLEMIGASPTVGLLADLSWGGLQPGAPVAYGAALFPRRDLPKPAEGPAPKAPKANKKRAKQRAAKEADEAPALPETISFDEFMRVDLRAGLVRSAEAVQGSKKLLRLLVDLGEGEPRQIVAGIAQHFDPGALVGMTVTVVTNLAPREIFGLESQGMVLALDRPDGSLALLQPTADVPPGTRAH